MWFLSWSLSFATPLYCLISWPPAWKRSFKKRYGMAVTRGVSKPSPLPPLFQSSYPLWYSNMAMSHHGEALDTIHLLLGSNIRVTMTDGRVVVGKFTCLDRLGNIILEDVVEQRWLSYSDASANDQKTTNQNNGDCGDSKSINNNLMYWNTERSLTKAVILGKKVTKVEITKQQWEARVP